MTLITILATRENLNSIMEFDRVIRVDEDGTVSEPSDVYEPDLYDDEVSDGWTLLFGWSGQYGYSGPIMHPSEFIVGRLADHILSTPGFYVALINEGSEDDASPGWAVAYRPFS